jgi:ATP synthase I chain
MTALRETQKKYCSRAMTVAILAGFGLIIAGQNSMGKGLILGTLFSVVNFVVMGETIPFNIGKSKRRALVFSVGSVLLRYSLMAVPVVLALKFQQFHLIAVICGLFLIQLVILAEHIALQLFSSPSKRFR